MHATVGEARTPVVSENVGAGGEDDRPWRSRLRAALRGRSTPLLAAQGRIIPGASLWSGARLWAAACRDAGLRPGDRVALALEPSPAFVMALVGALCEGLTVAVAPPGVGARETADAVDASLSIADDEGPHTLPPDAHGGPVGAGVCARGAACAPTPDARLLLRTSGTGGAPTWVAMSDENVLAVMDSHAPALGLEGATALSVLPWGHAFGLIIDLLPALLGGAEIVREPSGGRDARSVADALRRWGATHCSMTPLQAARLRSLGEGRSAALALRGGVVGGAPVHADLAGWLSATRLRAGYGQTEASPGVALGEPGEWEANYLGRPLGCETSLTRHGLLLVRGPNVSLGRWTADGLRRLPAGRWLDTRDLVERRGDRLFFVGRADGSFKLSNGRFVRSALVERAIREAVPGALEAAVASVDGDRVWVALALACGASHDVEGAVRGALGGLAPRLAGVRTFGADDAPRTAKGALDRRAAFAGAGGGRGEERSAA